MKRIWVIVRRKKERIRETIAGQQVKENILQAIPFWIASLLTGLVAVIYTRMFSYSEGLLQQMLHWHSWAIFILAPLCFTVAWLIVQTFAPNAKGSGIPQVMAAIELSTPKHESSVPALLNFKIIVTKIASSMLMVLGGGAIGREGPTIQIAGSIFRLVNRWVPASWPRLSQKSFILTGAAAGLAAAFNTPLGGIVFAIEELARIHISLFRTALFTAVIIAGLTAQGLLGPYLYLGYPDVQVKGNLIFFGVVAVAILSGMLGSIMSNLVLKLLRWRKTFTRPQTFMFIISVGLVTACVAYFFNWHMLGSGKDIMNETLFTADKHVSWHTVLFRTIGTGLSFSVGAAGGVFAPSLAAGASVGAFFSGLLGIVGANANILILSGMVGFLTGVTRTPFTSSILVLEMTDRHSVIFHLMLAGMVANIVAIIIDKHSLYEQLKNDYIEDVLREEAKHEPIEVAKA